MFTNHKIDSSMTPPRGSAGMAGPIAICDSSTERKCIAVVDGSICEALKIVRQPMVKQIMLVLMISSWLY
jgi:hypothetical protein